ncbi:CBS domain-containing protein [Micromonospora musae]|uniref:CBS domain-containing protein n=1 Tax=Micromonospora musae TaxID=1894970 RepID=A0A3A9Y6Z6_9ACTN|nr:MULTISPECIES: CBS domain-containing protein [Micromonospora]RKN14586.1 CBS domain-containing protein [Micromonospora musae]RKN29634.1 CBS domain-containing protein [Micromonospora musae]TYC00088.1 CBS domain-containing protein [Micromonospora sp. WP24]
MQVREAMTSEVLVVGPEHTLRQAARMMSARGVGSAVVIDPDSEGIGIMTERDVLNAIGAGLDCDVERAAAHLTWEVVYAVPEWTLEEAAVAMARGGFRHLVVLDGREVAGVISVRDIMRVWAAGRMVSTG